MTISPDIFTVPPQPSASAIPEGRLSGKALVVQPDLSVTGWLTDAGVKALSGYHAVFDATLVARLKAAGATLSASARMAELGFGLKNSTMRDALAPEKFHAGLMTDTLGEARMAACRAGWWGFKPSWGLLSRYGLTGLVPSCECTGIIAKTPADIAELLAVMAGPDPADASMSQDPAPDFTGLIHAGAKAAPLRVGVFTELREKLGKTAGQAFSNALDRLSRAGFTIEEIVFPDFPLFSKIHQIVAAVEASSSAGKYDGVRFGFRAETDGNWNDMYLATRGQAFGPMIKAFLMQGAYFQFQDYPAFEAACALRGNLVAQIDDAFHHCDLLALPTRAEAPDAFWAETIQDTYGAFGLTLPANLAGLPAFHAPDIATAADKADFGLQLMGPRMGDAGVLAAGQALYANVQGGI